MLVSTDSDVAHEVTLIPCNGSNAFQSWRFDKGLTTVTSITNVGAGLALGVGSATLFSAKYVAHSPVALTGLALFMLWPGSVTTDCLVL